MILLLKVAVVYGCCQQWSRNSGVLMISRGFVMVVKKSELHLRGTVQ